MQTSTPREREGLLAIFKEAQKQLEVKKYKKVE